MAPTDSMNPPVNNTLAGPSFEGTTTPPDPYDESEESSRIFVLGIAILLGWMFIMLLCARPTLFRIIIYKIFPCCPAPPPASTESAGTKSTNSMSTRSRVALMDRDSASHTNSLPLSYANSSDSSGAPTTGTIVVLDPEWGTSHLIQPLLLPPLREATDSECSSYPSNRDVNASTKF